MSLIHIHLGRPARLAGSRARAQLRPFAVGVAVLLMLFRPLSAQLSRFPAWANGLAITRSEIASRTSQYRSAVTKAFRMGPSHTSGMVPYRGYVFKNQTDSGVLAVWQVDPTAFSRAALGGISTAFTDVLFLGRTASCSIYAGYEHLLIWTGRRADGKWGVQLLPLAAGTTPSEGNVVTPPITSQQGEVWLTAGVVGDHLYVLDAANGKVIRFSSSGQGAAPTFDTRDPNFAVTIPVGSRLPIYAIVPDTDDLVRLVTDRRHPLTGGRYVIKSDGTQHEFLFVPDPSAFGSVPVFLCGPVSGMEQVAIVGPSAQVMKLQSASSPAGPWTDASQQRTMLGPTELLVVPLSQPLSEGGYLRVYNVSTSSACSGVRIGSARPVIFDYSPLIRTKVLPAGHVEANKPFTIIGDNLDLAPTVTLHERKPPGEPGSTAGVFVLQTSSVSKTSITVQAPNISCSGTIEITNGHGEDAQEITIRKK